MFRVGICDRRLIRISLPSRTKAIPAHLLTPSNLLNIVTSLQFAMTEEDFGPASIPLPPTDDTVYFNNSGAVPSSDFHSNAHGSEDDLSDEETNENTNEQKELSDIEGEDDELDEDADELTDLPAPTDKMVTLTPSFNRSTRSTRSTRSRRSEPSSELSEARSMIDEQGDHEMQNSDELENDKSEDEDEEMEDDEPDTTHAQTTGRITRRGTGGKVRNHRESEGSVVHHAGDRPSSSRSHDNDEDDEAEGEEEEQGDDEELEELEENEEEDADEEDEEGSGNEQDFDSTIRIPMHTPSRSAVPRRLLGNTSPGRTPLARIRAASAATTPAGYIPSLDFTTPGIAASSFPATVGRLNMRTPFLYQGTPINLSRPNAVQHHQLAVQNEMLFDEIMEKEAQIKYLQGLVESAAASPFEAAAPLTDAEIEDLVSYGDSPEKKRVRLSTGGDSTPNRGELSVPKKRGKRGSGSVAATPVPALTRKGLRSAMATPQTAFKGSPVKTLFENMTMTPSRFSVTANNLFGTPTRIPMPQFEMKTKRQRKEDKRRRMTAQLREFSEINIDMLKGWLPGDGTVPEEEEEDGELPVGPKTDPTSTITPVAEEPEEEEDEGKIEEAKPQEEKQADEKPQSELAADKDGDLGMADAVTTSEEAALLPNTISAPAQIPTRQLQILPAGKVLTTRKRSNSAPAVPHAPTTAEEEEEDDADISISPIAQEMITALQQRCLALERDIETTNAALQKATAQLVGEMRARKAAEEVREFLETEKKFGVCCDAGRKEVAAQASSKKRKASAAAATASMPPPAAGKKRTRDESEASAQPEPKAAAVRPTSRAAANRPPSRTAANRPPEKRLYSGPTGIPAPQVPPAPPTRPTRATAARAAAAKKPLGKAVANEQPRHPPITTAMEKPAVRGGGIPRPKSRLAERDEEPAPSGRTTRARSGSTAGEAGRPMSRYGDRPVRTVEGTGLDVFGRLATGTRRR